MTLLPQKMQRESAAALADVPIFAGLPKRHLEKIAKLAATKRYAQDAKMVVLEGTALVTAGHFTDVVIGPGDFFGEMALLDGFPRSATVTSETPVTVMIVTRSKFMKLLETEPTIGIAMLKTLSLRVRAANLSM